MFQLLLTFLWLLSLLLGPSHMTCQSHDRKSGLDFNSSYLGRREHYVLGSKYWIFFNCFLTLPEVKKTTASFFFFFISKIRKVNSSIHRIHLYLLFWGWCFECGWWWTSDKKLTQYCLEKLGSTSVVGYKVNPWERTVSHIPTHWHCT